MRNDFIKYLTDNNTNPIDYFGPVDVYTEEFPDDYEEDNDDEELDFVQPHKKTKVNLKVTSIVDDEVNRMEKILGIEEVDLNNPKDREEFLSALDKATENEKRMAKFYIDKADALDDIPLFGMDPHDKEEIDECYAEAKRHLQLYGWLKDYKCMLSENLPKIKEDKKEKKTPITESLISIPDYAYGSDVSENDYIKRKDVLDIIRQKGYHWEISRIEQLPGINISITGYAYKCSCCGHTLLSLPTQGEPCPNCGASLIVPR